VLLRSGGKMAKVEAQYVVKGDIIDLGYEKLRVIADPLPYGERVLVKLDDLSSMMMWGTEEVELVNL
jgi:hypothetical protein